MPSDPVAAFREILLQHEKTLRDLAHEVKLARNGGRIPPWLYTSLSNAATDVAEVMEHYHGQRIPSEALNFSAR